MSNTYSAALPITHVVLRILVVLNWLTAPRFLCCSSLAPTRPWIMSALDLSPGAEAERVDPGPAHRSPAIGLVTIPINFLILKRLLAIVETVRAGHAFVAANALAPADDRLGAARAAGPQHRHRRHRADDFEPGDARSISMPASRSTAGSPCCSRSCWPACSPKARSCAKSSKGRCDGDRRQTRRPAARPADDADRARGPDRHHAGQPVDPQNREGARHPILDARGDLRGARVPARRHSALRAGAGQNAASRPPRPNGARAKMERMLLPIHIAAGVLALILLGAVASDGEEGWATSTAAAGCCSSAPCWSWPSPRQ